MSETLWKAARRVKGPRGVLREIFLEAVLRATYNPEGGEQVTVSIDSLSGDICSRRHAKRLLWQLCHTSQPLMKKAERKRRRDGTLGVLTYTFMTPFPATVEVPALPEPTPCPGDTASPVPGDMVSPQESEVFSGSEVILKKIEAAAQGPSLTSSTNTLDKEKNSEPEKTESEPPKVPLKGSTDFIIDGYRKTPTPTAFLACMHVLRKHLGLKALDKFLKNDYMNVPELFDIIGSPAQAFDVLADFARSWATGPRPHFCPRQVFMHSCMLTIKPMLKPTGSMKQQPCKPPAPPPPPKPVDVELIQQLYAKGEHPLYISTQVGVTAEKVFEVLGVTPEQALIHQADAACI
jgi:hypothetical protein